MDVPQPVVSVVIPLYNQGEYVREAVDSVRRSTLEDVEIIVVDDGSTDPVTIDMVGQLGTEGLRVIRQANAGLSSARNTGMRAASGRYILPLDADDRVDPTYLEKAAWVLERHPDVGFVTTWVQCFGLSDELWAPLATAKPHDWWLQNRSGPAGVFRKELWQRTGGYETSLHSYEDWDFWLQLLEAGAVPHQLPEPLFHYRVKQQSTYLDALANHDELVEMVRLRHPGATTSARRSRIGIDGSELARRFARTSLGNVAVRALWRDVAVVRHDGLEAWVKWRGFQIASRVPGAVTTYRTARALARPNLRSAPGGNPSNQVTPRLRVRRPRAAGILFIVPWLKVGGADKVNLDILRRLDQRRYHPV
ncbi:MAG: glycosyltransferase family A protein, partial [Acidimicrobiales bacterium]